MFGCWERKARSSCGRSLHPSRGRRSLTHSRRRLWNKDLILCPPAETGSGQQNRNVLFPTSSSLPPSSVHREGCSASGCLDQHRRSFKPQVSSWQNRSEQTSTAGSDSAELGRMSTSRGGQVEASNPALPRVETEAVETPTTREARPVGHRGSSWLESRQILVHSRGTRTSGSFSRTQHTPVCRCG